MHGNKINYLDLACNSGDAEENRKSGRFPTTSVWSSLGEVLDLSTCGALIIKRRFRRAPTDKVFTIEIKYEEIKATVNARLVRCIKKRSIGHLLAVEFIDPTDEQREALRDVVRNSRNWRLFDFSEGEAA